MKLRLYYFISVLITITIGLASRKIPGIPLYIGDALYAVMIYLILRAFFLKPQLETAIVAALLCFAIELSQLIQCDWLVGIRRTTLGHLILGEGFLWSDIVAYTFGVCVLYVLENLLHKKTENSISGF